MEKEAGVKIVAWLWFFGCRYTTRKYNSNAHVLRAFNKRAAITWCESTSPNIGPQQICIHVDVFERVWAHYNRSVPSQPGSRPNVNIFKEFALRSSDIDCMALHQNLCTRAQKNNVVHVILSFTDAGAIFRITITTAQGASVGNLHFFQIWFGILIEWK